MIALARQFDMQMKLLQNAESNARQASQLLGINCVSACTPRSCTQHRTSRQDLP